MVRRTHRVRSLAVGLLALSALATCGGKETPANPTPSPTPIPSSSPTPAPGPTATPNPAPTPDTQRCAKLEDGPVVRVAIQPRGQFDDGDQVPMRVQVTKPYEDEAWCIDKDKDHKLDFNLNQRNADGKECCWESDPVWTVDDPDFIVNSSQWRDSYGFIFRIRVNPKGKKGHVFVQARLDGLDSYPWQSISYYSKGPLEIVSMSAGEIARNCQCIYKGNGQYEGDKCPK